MSLAIWTDETTGFNDRAEALAAAAVEAFGAELGLVSAEDIAAIDAERAALAADLAAVFGGVYDGDRLVNFMSGIHKHLDDVALNPTLTNLRRAAETQLKKAPGESFYGFLPSHQLTANELLGLSGFDPEVVTAAGVAGVAALEAVAEGLGITDPE